MKDEIIDKTLKTILKSENNVIQIEYLVEFLRVYIQDKKEIYLENKKKYDEEKLNTLIKKGFYEYNKRAKKFFYKELIMLILTLIITTVILVLLKIDTYYIYMAIFATFSLYIIIRKSFYQNNLKNESEKLYKKYVDKDIINFVESMKNE